MGMRLVVSV